MIDARLSTQAALQAFWTERRLANLCTDDEMYEGVGREDVTGFTEKLLTETLVKADTPQTMMEAQLAYAEAASIRQARDIMEILTEMGVDPQFEAATGGEGGPGGISRTGSPTGDPAVTPAAGGLT